MKKRVSKTAHSSGIAILFYERCTCEPGKEDVKLRNNPAGRATQNILQAAIIRASFTLRISNSVACIIE